MEPNQPLNITDSIRETAMLADVSISVWSGSRTDNNLLGDLKKTHGAKGDVGRVIKNLLAGADGPLKAARSAYMAVRSRHYELTLPWVNDPHAARQAGPRLLPNELFNQYLADMGRLKREAEASLEELLEKYPDLVEKAKTNLGRMADTNYPSVDELRSSFRVSFDFEPIPQGASFKGLSPSVVEKLGQKLAKKQEAQLQHAVGAMWTEAKKRIDHLVDRLTPVEFGDQDITSNNDDAPKFKEATVEAVRALGGLLKGWNITQDPRVDELKAQLETLLDGIDAKELRKHPKVRAEVATGARKLSDKLRSWGV